MRRMCKPLFWRATRPVNSTDCMIEGRYCLKRIIIDIFILCFKKYFHSFIQSAVFTDVWPAKTTACTFCAWLWNWLIKILGKNYWSDVWLCGFCGLGHLYFIGYILTTRPHGMGFPIIFVRQQIPFDGGLDLPSTLIRWAFSSKTISTEIEWPDWS